MISLFQKFNPKRAESLALDVLRHVLDPDTGQDIVSLGMVSAVQISPKGEAVFAIEVPAERAAALESMRVEAERAVAGVKGVQKVTAVLTAQVQRVEQSAATPQTRAKSAASGAKKMPHEVADVHENQLPIRRIIAVSSGKGGVGKSTVSASIAQSLANFGQKVGLLDADIYGPSQPHMMGLSGQKPGGEKGAIIPLESHGVKVMSIGFMVGEDSPLIWRGPMAQSAMMQLLTDVQWGTDDDPLDVLIVDMPPGTGDIALSLSQKVPLSGAMIVSTPQDIALLDARKGIEMFRKVGVPILGVVENMSTYVCANCGHEEHVFGHGGARAEAEKLGVPFLGAIPLSRKIREAADAGEMLTDNNDVFSSIARVLLT